MKNPSPSAPKGKNAACRAAPSPSPRCDARREYPTCAAMKKHRISVSQFYHSKSHKSTFSDRFFRSPVPKSDLRIARGGAVRKVMHGIACRRDVCRNADAFTAGKARLPIKLRRRKLRTDEARSSHRREDRPRTVKAAAAPPLKRCISVKPTASRNTVHTGKIRRATPKKQKEKRRRNSVFPLTLYVIAVEKSGFGSQPFPRAADPRPQDDPSGGIQLSNDGRQIRGWQSRQLGLTP